MRIKDFFTNIIIFIVICLFMYGRNMIPSASKHETTLNDVKITEAYLTKNRYSRPGTALKKVNGIVIHYTANPGSTAQANRDYYESLKDTRKTKVSAHFVIGLRGEIIQCIPLDEIAYCSNNRNKDTVSIECCHKDESGKLNTRTYNSLVKLTQALMNEYTLSRDDILRHYDVTGKNCPKYFVEHQDAWEKFKNKLS